MDNYTDNKYNDLLYVNCYAKKNNMCNSISKLKNGMCNKCYKDINRNLSKKELFDNYISIKKTIVDKFKTLLNGCSITFGRKNKVKDVLHIYDIIYHNIYFSLTSVIFIKTYINKIITFIKDDMNIFNEVVDEQINYNEMYIDIIDFIVNIYEHYKDINFNQLSDEQFLLEYNNFMKELYNTICKRYNNEQSLNKEKKEEEEQEENIENSIYYNTFYHILNSIQIDV